jgi:hypothetical protein
MDIVNAWTVTYNDAEGIVSVDVYGKVSLDDSWFFALDTEVDPPVVTIAVPVSRVIDVQLLET